jgi:hypothetical protein
MKKRNQERGTALLFALVVLAILSIGTSALWRQLHSNLQQHRVAWHKEQAFQLAEAGLESSIAHLRATADTYTGEKNVPLGAGTFSVVVTPGEGRGVYRITSTGRLENAAYRFDTVTLSAALHLADNGRILNYAWQQQKGEVQP